MSDFPALIDLENLGSYGFKILGQAAGDSAGASVSSAGDINGDGFDDFLVGAPFNGSGGYHAGAVYVLFGKAGGQTTIDLANLAAADGFKIKGPASHTLGGSVSAAGDVNGDGFDDFVIGGNGGAAWVIFGKESGFGALDLNSLSAADGFRIQGDSSQQYAGNRVSSAGDVNGDGYDDILVGARGNQFTGSGEGAAYVIFGKASGFGQIDLANLDPAAGFRIDGDDSLPNSNDYAGASVSSAGDVNGDGFDDLFIGAPGNDSGGSGAGAAYVIFGKASGFANIDLATLAAADGFKIQGDAADDLAGWGVSTAGDVNGDGYGDIVIGAQKNSSGGTYAGAAYVIFGKAGGFGTIDLGSLAAADGFKIQGDAAGDVAGDRVASAGDVNGDGFDDILVGAFLNDADGYNSGSAYVIFGKASGFTNIDLSALAVADGFRMFGARANDSAGQGLSSAGDINGDGFDDVIVGAFGYDVGGYLRQNSGAAYVVFGIAPTTSVNRTGTVADQTIGGGAFDDTLDGAGGDDSLFGGGGSDTLIGGTGADAMSGGAGNDLYFVDDAGDTVIELDGAGIDEVRTALGSKAPPDRLVYVLPDFIENLTGTSAGAQGVRDNALDNLINMGAGHDLVVVDAGGVDTVDGGGGNDFIYAGDKLTAADIANGGSGVDTIGLLGDYGAGLTFTAANLIGVERMALYTSLYLPGTGPNNYAIVMNDANVAAGTEFFVTAASLQSNESLTFNGAAETNGRFTIHGGGGADTIIGGAGGDFIIGNGGADTLYGLGGQDFLIGGLGADQLRGGAGGDRYLYQNVSHSTAVAADQILDFQHVDRIDLSAIDANGNAGDGNSAFTFIGAAAFGNVAGELRAYQNGGNWFVEGDTNGDGLADLVIQVTLPDATPLGAADFIL